MTNVVIPDVMAWLLEEDDPGPRYLALRNLFSGSPDELARARKDAHASGIISKIIKNMHPDGYWVKPGGGYSPKYRSGVWSLIALAQCGASVYADPRIRTACNYYLDHAVIGLIQYRSCRSLFMIAA